MMIRGLVLLVGTLSLNSSPVLTLFVAGPLSRVGPKDAPGTLRQARIKSARNEYQAFQVVVRSGADGLKDVTAAASDLQGEGGRRIDRSHISLFREQFIELRTPSPKSKMAPGFLPDALIPFEGPWAVPVTGGKLPRFCAIPFSLSPDTNQPLWIEVYVPKEATPGEYSGTVKVSAHGLEPVQVPVALTVWDFALPETPTLRTNFGGLGRRLLTGHPGYKPNSPPYRTLERRYAESMSAHRICPPVPPYLRPKVAADGTIDPKETHAALKEWIGTFHLTGLQIDLLGEDPAGKDRDRNVKFLKSTWAYLKENGWEKMAYVYVLDEPGDAKAYDEIRKRARMIHEAQPGFKVLCTEQPIPENPAWGTLVGSVDIWVPLNSLFDEKSAAERQKAGEEVWSYTARCEGKPGADTPYWELDFPLLNYRIAPWTSRRYGLSGLLYWTMVFWPSTDVWLDPRNYKEFNGEGCLFYPGADAGLEGPVPSMRLKALRDGFQDYEYLILAGEAGAAKAASLARSWVQWESDPAKLESAREDLARLILERKR